MVKKLSVFLVALLFMSLPQTIFAQAVNGTLLGSVTDATGAVVSNAKVTIVLTGQSVEHNTVTNGSGDFTVPDLPSGTYSITVVAPGFKKETRENIALATNVTLRVDVSLVPGSASESITVTTAPPELQTDRADISSTLEQTQITSLPLSSGNSFQSLLNIVPGNAPVVFNNSQFYNANNDLSTNSNGQSSYVNLYQIEGIDDDQRTGIHIILVPPAASIQNVDITTNNFEAEFGRAVGTVVNVTLKSGTNQFHGSVYQNMENNGVNARNYFSAILPSGAAAANGRLVYNYTGASIGGPIVKNKLFIFGDYLHVSDHEEVASTTNIPYYNVVGTGSNAYIDLSGYSGQVYDPNSGPYQANCLGGANSSLCGTGRTAIASNHIYLNNTAINSVPSTVGLTVLQDLDALARNPAINLASTAYIAGAAANNFSRNLPFHKDAINYDIKSDYTMSQKDHLSGRFSHQTSNTYQAPMFGSFLGGPLNAGNGGFEATGTAAAYSTGLNYDHVFSPTLFTEARFGIAHLRNSAQQSDYGADDAKTLGIPGNGPNGTDMTATSSGQVAFQVSNFAGDGAKGTANPLIGYSQSLPWLRAESNIDLANNWTLIKGNHTLKAGADIRRVRDDLLQGNNNAAAGTFYFSENQTSLNISPQPATGQANDIASVLFDTPYQVGQDTNSTFPCFRQTWLFFFVSDKWQVTHKLTVDLGLRYELYPPATPRKAGGFVSYNPANDQLVVAGVDGNPSNIGMKTDYANYAPRLGASYRLSEKTVIRAGFGISYVPFVDNSYAYNYPIKTSTYYTNTPTYGAALNPAGGVVNFVTGIPATPTATFTSGGTLTESAANGTIGLANLYIPLNFKNAYASSWNVAVERALPKNMSLQIAYVANHGTRIDVAQNINVPSVYGQSSTYDPFNNVYTGGSTVPTFGKTAGVTQYFMGFSSNYESLQAQLTKRASAGLTFTSSFTWGKAQGYATTPQDGALFYFAGDRRRNYNLLDFDRKLNAEEVVTYELPFGKGHKWINDNSAANLVIGGWKISAVIGMVSGLPFSVTTTSATSGTTQTANIAGPFTVTHGVTNPVGTGSPTWFDTSLSSFTVPASCSYTPGGSPCAFGTSNRNQFRGPAYFSDNLSLFKSFPLFRASSLEARFDAFNMTNTPAFGLPNSTYAAPPAAGQPDKRTFGKITSTLGSGVGNVNGVGGPRVLQAAVKFTF
jgi:hypothetical protein